MCLADVLLIFLMRPEFTERMPQKGMRCPSHHDLSGATPSPHDNTGDDDLDHWLMQECLPCFSTVQLLVEKISFFTDSPSFLTHVKQNHFPRTIFEDNYFLKSLRI